MERFPRWNDRIDPHEEKRKKEAEKSREMTRRKFLITTLLGAGALALGFHKIGEKEEGPTEENALSKKDVKRFPVPETPDYIPGEDRKAAQHILGEFSLKEIKLGPEVKENTKSYWYKKYENDPRLRKSLIDAYFAMEEWKDRLVDIFTEEKVPPELIYLAIPESHWNLEKPSPAGAVGPYQFMADTANKFGLVVDEKVDERRDVLKSARAAAKLLADLYRRTGSWDLALSGYNGGQIWGYLKTCEKEQGSYSGFLKYMEGGINQLKKDVSQPIWKHIVSNKELTLNEVAGKYGVSVQAIMKVNKFMLDKKKNLIIREGQEINIPITDMGVKELIYNQKIGGYIENLNYPGKYYAVIEHVRKMKKGNRELVIKEQEMQERLKREQLMKNRKNQARISKLR